MTMIPMIGEKGFTLTSSSDSSELDSFIDFLADFVMADRAGRFEVESFGFSSTCLSYTLAVGSMLSFEGIDHLVLTLRFSFDLLGFTGLSQGVRLVQAPQGKGWTGRLRDNAYFRLDVRFPILLRLGFLDSTLGLPGFSLRFGNRDIRFSLPHDRGT